MAVALIFLLLMFVVRGINWFPFDILLSWRLVQESYTLEVWRVVDLW